MFMTERAAHGISPFALRYTLTTTLAVRPKFTVYLCKHNASGQFVVAKCFPGSSGLQERRELHAMRTLAHRHIVQALDIFRDRAHGTCVVMEWVREGTLARMMEVHRRVSERAYIFGILVPIAKAIAYMHGVGFVHRDVRPENILVDERCGAKLCGFSSTVDPTVEDGRDSLPQNSPYVAPEARLGAPPSPEEDVWSLGETSRRGRAVVTRTTGALNAAIASALRESPDERPHAREFALLLVAAHQTHMRAV